MNNEKPQNNKSIYGQKITGGTNMPQIATAALTILGLITVWTGVLVYVL